MTKFELLKQYVKKNAGKFKDFNDYKYWGYRYKDLSFNCSSGATGDGTFYWIKIKGIDVDEFSQNQLEEIYNYIVKAYKIRKAREEKQKQKKVEEFFRKLKDEK